jgi:hypothetical protein
MQLPKCEDCGRKIIINDLNKIRGLIVVEKELPRPMVTRSAVDKYKEFEKICRECVAP